MQLLCLCTGGILEGSARDPGEGLCECRAAAGAQRPASPDQELYEIGMCLLESPLCSASSMLACKLTNKHVTCICSKLSVCHASAANSSILCAVSVTYVTGEVEL